MKILSLVFPGFTLIDLAGPVQALSRLPGASHQFVWKQPGLITSDTGISVTATHSFDDSWADVDLLFVPGGARPVFDLLHDQQTAEFLADRGSRAEWVTSVCTGSLLLGVAGLLNGYRAASYWYAREVLSRYGATPDPSRVVIDRNRITGGGMTAGVDFGLTLVGMLAGEERGRIAELAMEYAPTPPFGTGRPDIADAATLAAAEAVLAHAMPLESAPERPLVPSPS